MANHTYRTPTSILLTVVCGYGLCGLTTQSSYAQESAEGGPTAEQILADAEKVYETCKSYSDTGEVKTAISGGERDLATKKPFTTAFVRPDRFRFEYASQFPMPGSRKIRHIVWADGEDVRVWWDVDPGVKKDLPLSMAIAQAMGVSDGSAQWIPGLLMPDRIPGRMITHLQEPKRTADSREANADCYRIEGKWLLPNPVEVTLWINKNTNLIHRIDTIQDIPRPGGASTLRAESTTTYQPRIDVDTNEEELAFNAPRQ